MEHSIHHKHSYIYTNIVYIIIQRTSLLLLLLHEAATAITLHSNA